MKNVVLKDVFTFDASYIYSIKLMDGDTVIGTVIEVYDNGIVLNSMQHIPTDKIVHFTPLQSVEENGTEK